MTTVPAISTEAQIAALLDEQYRLDRSLLAANDRVFWTKVRDGVSDPKAVADQKELAEAVTKVGRELDRLIPLKVTRRVAKA